MQKREPGARCSHATYPAPASVSDPAKPKVIDNTLDFPGSRPSPHGA